MSAQRHSKPARGAALRWVALIVVIALWLTPSVAQAQVGPVSDDFDCANSDSVGCDLTFQERAGDCDIASNELTLVTGGFADNVCAYEAMALGVNQWIRVQIPSSASTSANYQQIAFRFTNASSPYYYLQIEVSSAAYEWTRVSAVGGTASVIASGNLGTADGRTTLGLTLDGTGTNVVLRIWIGPSNTSPTSASGWDSGGDTADISITTDPASPVDTGSAVALAGQASGASAIKYNDFYAGSFDGGGGGGSTACQRILLLGVGGSCN